MIKLLAVDMDGTCLDGRSRITNHTIQALREAATAGITVVPTTGRNLFCLPHRLAEGILYSAPTEDGRRNHGLFRYVISSNGARVTDVRGRTTLFRAMIPKETTLSLLESCRGYRLITASHINNRYLVQGRMAAVAGRVIYGKDAKGIYCVRDMMQTVKRGAFQTEELQFYLLTKQSRQRLEVILELYPDLTAAYTSVYVEVFSKNAAKGRALRTLAQHLGITREETACIGDGENDLSMFEASGLNIAMGNAVEKLKNRADYVTASNNRNGVAKAVRMILSEQRVSAPSDKRRSAGILHDGLI